MMKKQLIIYIFSGVFFALCLGSFITGIVLYNTPLALVPAPIYAVTEITNNTYRFEIVCQYARDTEYITNLEQKCKHTIGPIQPCYFKDSVDENEYIPPFTLSTTMTCITDYLKTTYPDPAPPADVYAILFGTTMSGTFLFLVLGIIFWIWGAESKNIKNTNDNSPPY